MRSLACVILFALCLYAPSLKAQQNIRYNMAGYEPCRPKQLLILSRNNIVGSAWTIKDAEGKEVLKGQVGKSLTGAGDYTPKNFNYSVDFSALNKKGTYRFELLENAPVELSITDKPYEKYADEILRYFRVHRSGSEECLDHSVSHLGDSACAVFRRTGTDNGQWTLDENTAKVNMTGGWYDAGDYIKFTLTTAYSTYNLLRAYEANPEAFNKKIYSKSALIDILDEARFGLEYLMKTMPSPDLFIIQVGGATDHQQGNRLPEDDNLDGKRECYTALSKPQMGLTAAALALGAKIFKAQGKTADAKRYEKMAMQIFQAAENSKEPTAWWQGGHEVFYSDNSDMDNMCLAAAELHRLTENQDYLDKAISYADQAQNGWWAAWATCHMHAHYRLMEKNESSTRYLKNDLNAFKSISVLPDNIWGVPHQFTWGTLYSFIDVANGAATYYQASGDAQYNAMIYNTLDYIFGRNNWGISFITSQTLPKAMTVSYSQFYKMKPKLFPIGEIVQGPGDKVTHDKLGFQYGPTWEDEFNTELCVFYAKNDNYMTVETTIGGESDALFLFAIAGKVLSCK